MTDLMLADVPNAAAILTDTTEGVIERLEQFTRHVETASAPQIPPLRENVRLLQAWLKAKKAARDLRVAASRLEYVVFRRVGQLGCTDVLDYGERRAALWLADMPDDEFATFMARVGLAGPVTAYNKARAENEQDRDRNDLHEGAVEKEHWSVGKARDSFEQIVAEVFDTLEAEGEPFTVFEATDRIQAKWLLASNNKVLFSALEHLVRQRLIANDVEFLDETGRHHRLPRFITSFGNEVLERRGWVRIPWRSASAFHLSQLVEERRRQSDELARRADALEAFGRLVEPHWPAATDALGVMVDAASVYSVGVDERSEV